MLTRRQIGISAGAAALLAACSRGGGEQSQTQEKQMSDQDWANLTEADWKARLTEQEFYVLRKEGTERPWTSPLNLSLIHI